MSKLIHTNGPFCVGVDAHTKIFRLVYMFCLCVFYAYILVCLYSSCTVATTVIAIAEGPKVYNKLLTKVAEKRTQQNSSSDIKERVLVRSRKLNLACFQLQFAWKPTVPVIIFSIWPSLGYPLLRLIVIATCTCTVAVFQAKMSAWFFGHFLVSSKVTQI